MSYRNVSHLLCAAATLLVAVPVAGQQAPCSELSRGTGARVISSAQIASSPSRSALDLLDQYVPNTFEVVDDALALRARGARSRGVTVEPLLLLDGTPMEGSIASVLDGLMAGDLARIEVYLGTAAAWRYRPGGAAAVIEVTTVAGERFAPQRAIKTCLGGESAQ